MSATARPPAADAPPSLLARLSPRRSFAGKLLAALIGTLTAVLAVAFAAVRAETAAQVERAAARAAAVADTTFRSIEGVQRARLAEVAGRVAGGRRAVAALEAATESGEVEPLIADVDYDLELSQLSPEQVLVVLTDPDGRTIVARAAGRMVEGDDPAGVRSLVDRMYEEGVPEVRAYRVVDGRLYNLHSAFLELGGRPVGTFTLGLPLGDEEARLLGGVVGAEVCFEAAGRCLAGTAAAPSGPLGELLAAGASRAAPARLEQAGRRWSVSATPLDPADGTVGHRVMAVPLDPVLEPFDRIARTLAAAGLAALALSALLGALLARGLTRPVRALVAATGRVARGDYDAEVTATSADELGALARSFNQMTHGLRLKERYRGVLDKVVSPEVAEELMHGGVELGGENREVTVLFADIRGFTPLTEGMEPQAVIRLLNDCMAILSAAVDAEGGVVDKYVGDQIMAVFGAPVRSSDHPLRALRAALRMQAGVAAMNAERARREQLPIRIGVGVNTGVAVAGNMGSPQRLNYTVLGEAVNLASRLCAAAAPGQVLTTRGTIAAAGESVRAISLGERAIKGFSTSIEVLAVEEAGTDGVEPDPVRSSARRGVVAGCLIALWCAAPCAPLAAQAVESGLPTLEDLGLWWSSPSGRYQGALSGRADVEHYVPTGEPVGLLAERDPISSGRLRLFLDAFAGERVYASAELRVDRGETPRSGGADARLEQIFVRVRPTRVPAEVQVGRFASPFGAYAARHHTAADFFIRPPLPYDVRTVVNPAIAPDHVASFLTWQDRAESFRPTGAPVIWNVPYQWGAMALVAAGPVAARAAWMNSAPSSSPGAWAWDGDRLEEGSLVVGALWSAAPELSLGASWASGPYLEPLARGTLPAGAAPADYRQRLFGLEATYARGPVVVRAEGFHDRWDVPNVADPATDLSGYVEAQTDVVAGVWVAGRIGVVHFAELDDGAGRSIPWDDDVWRTQIAAGYRIVRNAELKLEWLHNDMSGPRDLRDDLVSTQIWWAY